MTRRALRIEKANEKDVPLILNFILELAEYEKLADSVTATEERLRMTLFGPKPLAQAVIAYDGEEPVAFATYFFNYSTFSARPSLYLEDIYVHCTEARELDSSCSLFSPWRPSSETARA